MVAVDRFSKYAHFAALPSKFDAQRVAALFVHTVVKHHGFPETLVSDRDPIFLSDFWKELLRLSGTTLHFSTAYHPQSDGQTEVRNRGLEQYLRAFTFDKPRHWFKFLPWAELSLNCNHHEGLGTTPFKALYGRDPPSFFPASPSAKTPRSVADIIEERVEVLNGLKRNLAKAQQRMRAAANKHRQSMEFQVDDMVLLKLKQYRQHSVARPVSVKLARHFYGPFRVLERIGPVAYRLELPPNSRIHNVFHVSLLRPYVPGDTPPAPADLPPEFFESSPVVKLVALLSQRTVLRKGKSSTQGLVRWANSPESASSWEPMEIIATKFPYLLEGKELANPGGVDTDIGTAAVDNGEEPLVTEADQPEEEEEQHETEEERGPRPEQNEPVAFRTRRRIQRPKYLEDYA